MACPKKALDSVVAEVAVITFAQGDEPRSVIDALMVLGDRLFDLQQAVKEGLGPVGACRLAALHVVEAASRLDGSRDGALIEGLWSMAREVAA